jgi:carbon-monoxide dehydrogenase medium subunit
LDGDSVTDIRLAACGVGPGPIRLTESEMILRARGLSDDALAAAGDAAAAAADPDSDVHATAAYRRKMAGVMTKRAVEKAAGRARQIA